MSATTRKKVAPAEGAASARLASTATKSNATPKKIPESENWDWRLGFLMHDVSRLRRTVFDEFMKPVGVTRSQWWVLAHLSRHDGMIQSDLANLLDLGKAALGGLIDRLEEAGVVERRSDEADRRAKRLYLSAGGVKLIAEMRVQSHEMSERMLEGLDVPSRRALTDMLLHVKHNLVAIRAELDAKSART